MPDRRRLKGAEAWEEERQMNELNASLERDQKRRELACEIAAEEFIGTEDVEVSTPDDNRGVLAIESVDAGYWVSARVWVDADEVEERLDADEADQKFLRKFGPDTGN